MGADKGERGRGEDTSALDGSRLGRIRSNSPVDVCPDRNRGIVLNYSIDLAHLGDGGHAGLGLGVGGVIPTRAKAKQLLRIWRSLSARIGLFAGATRAFSLRVLAYCVSGERFKEQTQSGRVKTGKN